MYKRRFENLSRVAKKVTSSLNIGDILEIIRDEAKATIPLKEKRIRFPVILPSPSTMGIFSWVLKQPGGSGESLHFATGV